MKNIRTIIASCLLGIISITAEAQKPLPTPTKSQLKWQEAEMGALFHYDLHVFDGERYGQGNNRISPMDDYNIFHPTGLNTDQWVKAAKDAGCRFAILTATHETGFGLWQSDVNPYSLKALKWKNGKGDIVGDFVKSCRKYHIAPALYIGLRWNSLLGIHNFKAEGDSQFAQKRQEWYRHYCERMVKELCTKYGDLFMIWFDGGADDPKGDGPDVERIISRYQPGCLFYHNVNRADVRWGGSETGTVGYPCWSTFPTPYSHNKNIESAEKQIELLKHGDPNGNYWVPAMADTPLRGANGRHEWFWEPGDEENLLPVAQLMDLYRKSVGRNATLVLGLTPDPEGRIPEGDVRRLKEFGKRIREEFGHPLAESCGNDTVEIRFKKPLTISSAIIQENIATGERVRSYSIQALSDGEWTTLCQGSSIGHKRIEEFSPVTAEACRLIIRKAVATPQIKRFALFGTR